MLIKLLVKHKKKKKKNLVGNMITLFLHSQNKKNISSWFGKRVDFVAQLVEHITFNDRALGSSPSEITKVISLLITFFY